MRVAYTKKQAALTVACTLALGIFSANAARPQAGDINEKALLVDSRGAPVMSGAGLCWHSGYGPAPSWTAGCHAEVPAPVAEYVAPAAQSAPAPIAAAAPRPAPVVAAAAAPLPVYEKVAFNADILFDSDKSTLRAAGRDTLDAFLGDIHGLESQSIRALGHADRMGSEGSNQLLSEDRVNTVKAYLVSRGVDAQRIRTTAWGESQPNTLATDCKDANTPQNVACMQPDRHVLIEISGTRIAQ